MTARIPAHLHEQTRRPSKNGIQPAFAVMHSLVWELFPNYRGVFAAGALATAVSGDREAAHAR